MTMYNIMQGPGGREGGGGRGNTAPIACWSVIIIKPIRSALVSRVQAPYQTHAECYQRCNQSQSGFLSEPLTNGTVCCIGKV